METGPAVSPSSVEGRLAHLEQRVLEAEEYLQAASHVLKAVSEQHATLGPRLQSIEVALQRAFHVTMGSREELDRLGPQLAALEQRIDRSTRVGAVGDPEPVELVRRAEEEHERTRTRMAIISSYEERISRLERA